MRTMIKTGGIISDIEDGLNAGMCTAGVARTGNMIGMTERDFASLPADLQNSRRRAARRKLRESGGPFVIGSAAGCEAVVDRMEERIAPGERP